MYRNYESGNSMYLNGCVCRYWLHVALVQDESLDTGMNVLHVGKKGFTILTPVSC